MASKKKNKCPCCGRVTAWRDRQGGKRLEVIAEGVSYKPLEGGPDLLLDAGGEFVSGVIRPDGKEYGNVPHFMVCDRARRAMGANKAPQRRTKPVPSMPAPDPQVSFDDVYAGFTRADDIAF